MKNIFTEEYIESLGDIEIAEPPYKINPDKLLYDEMIQRYTKICPYCNENVGYQYLICQNSFRHCGEWWRFWDIHFCKRIFTTCPNCGTGWYTPWFPQDLCEKESKKYKRGIKHGKISDI